MSYATDSRITRASHFWPIQRRKGRSCGYNLCADLEMQALTDATIDKAAVYRTLRQLEKNGNVKRLGRPRRLAPRVASTASPKMARGILKSGQQSSDTSQRR